MPRWRPADRMASPQPPTRSSAHSAAPRSHRSGDIEAETNLDGRRRAQEQRTITTLSRHCSSLSRGHTTTHRYRRLVIKQPHVPRDLAWHRLRAPAFSHLRPGRRFLVLYKHGFEIPIRVDPSVC
jgi:hypothetical protein